MSPFRILLPALLALAPNLFAQSSPLERAEIKLDEALVTLGKVAIAGVSPAGQMADAGVALQERLQILAVERPQGCRTRARLQAAMEALGEQARRWQLRFEDVEQFQEELIEARLDEALEDLDRIVAAKGLISAERHAHVSSLLQRRANAALDAVEAESVRSRLQAAFEDLVNAARRQLANAQHVKRMRAVLVENRVERYLGIVQQQVANGRITRFEYLLLEQRLVERQHFAEGIPFEPCN